MPNEYNLHGHYETSYKDKFGVLEEKLGKRQIKGS